MSKALDAGKSFLNGILAKLPESMRGSVQAAFDAPEAADALTTLGDGTLARNEFSRQMDALQQQQAAIQRDYAALTGWYDENKAALEAAHAARSAQPATPTTVTATTTAPSLSAEEFRKALQEAEQGAVRYTNVATKIQLQHFKDFQEVLDAEELVAAALQHRISVPDAYQRLHGERLKEKATAAESARIDALVQARLQEERKRHSDQPFPLRQAAPSVLDVLEDPDRGKKHDLDAAVSEYERLQLARGA